MLKNKFYCHANVYGGRHPQAYYRVRTGGYVFNACVRCTQLIGQDARRDGAPFKAVQIRQIVSGEKTL